MKKLSMNLLLLATLILTAGSVSYSQTSNNSTPNSDRAELVSRCEKAVEEVKVSRELIKGYQKTLDQYDETLGKAEEVMKLSAAEIANLKAQRDTIAEALKKERIAFDEKSKEAEQLRKDLASATKKKNFFKKMAKVGWVTAIAAAAGLILVSN